MPKSETQRINHWITISDFTAGCYNYSNISSGHPVVPASPGAATATHTIGCMALTEGGLGPLPGLVKTYTYPVGDPTYTILYIVGLASIPMTAHRDAVISMVEATTNAHTHRLYQVIKVYPTTTPLTHFTLITHVVATTNTTFFGSPFPALSRMTHTTPTTTPGQPVLVWPSSIPTIGTGTGQLWVWPNPTTPTSTTPVTIVGTGITGQVVVHNSRVLALVGIRYPMGNTFLNVNENISYTTPGNSNTYKTSRTVLSPQYPYGYSCAGSISAGELFLVKKRGGGILLSGDITEGSVINLPGVQSGGDFYGQVAQTPIGLTYCSTGQGAWLWNGGNLSQKISQNLTDNFFVCNNSVPGTNNLGFYCQTWGEWILFSNSWIYNTRQGSWWQWEQSTLFHFQPSRTPRYMYASPQIHPTTGSVPYLYTFDKQTPTTHWQWQSLPNRLEQNRYINIREIVLYCSNPANSASTFTITIYNETAVAFTYRTTATTTPIGIEPRMIRIATGGVQLYNSIIRIFATGTTFAAPILHSLTIGCTITHHAGPTL